MLVLKELNFYRDNPYHLLEKKEIDEMIIKFGSFLSIIYNKKISPTMYMVYILENKDYQDILMDLTHCETFKELLYHILVKYPILSKSKIVNEKIKLLYCK